MEWRKTKISENYEVSNTGLVRTCDRYVKTKGGVLCVITIQQR